MSFDSSYARDVAHSLEALNDHVEAIASSDVANALTDAFPVLEDLGKAAERIASALERQPVRFITVTRVNGFRYEAKSDQDPRLVKRDLDSPRLVNVSRIVMIAPNDTGATVLVSDIEESWIVRETPEEIMTMINAPAYEPPF